MNFGKIAIGALGVYLMLPGIEDAATGGATLAPSVLLGAALVAHAAGVKMPRLLS